MSSASCKVSDAGASRPVDAELVARLKTHFQAQDEVRRGVCLLNAGRYDEAAVAFSRAAVHGRADASLASYLAACHVGKGEMSEATRHLKKAAERDEEDVTLRIRHALALWADGRQELAIQALRSAVADFPESAELHFQLGTLLADRAEYEEAELRFTQAKNLKRDHAQALVALAMCCGVRNAPDEALDHLRRAQSCRPRDPSIGMALAQAAKATQQRGHLVGVHATMPPEAVDDREGAEELLSVIRDDPDFVDAFLSIPFSDVDQRVFSVLLRALEEALAHEPEHAELHYHCGQVLARLKRPREAIEANERAVGIDPKHTRALIALAKLYRQVNRHAEAARRLEEVVATGVEYADVFCMLGHLYREKGQLGRARGAYRRALRINDRYVEAQEALEALPV
jgi:protein O-GlcNAc transferase